MSEGKIFAWIIGGGVIGLIAGSAVGLLIATVIPGYYRSVFMGGNCQTFSPTEVGLGQGSTQGLFCGLGIGAAVVALRIWSTRTKPDSIAS